MAKLNHRWNGMASSPRRDRATLKGERLRPGDHADKQNPPEILKKNELFSAIIAGRVSFGRRPF
jgi:hypothetical protein